MASRKGGTAASLFDLANTAVPPDFEITMSFSQRILGFQVRGCGFGSVFGPLSLCAYVQFWINFIINISTNSFALTEGKHR